MGESPREKTSALQQQGLADLQRRILTGNLSGEAMFGKVDPFLQNTSDLIQRSVATRIGGLSQNVGESLVTGGVARGHDTGGAFLSALAPAIAGGTEQIARTEQLRGLTLADLITRSLSSLLQAEGLENQAIGGMKNTTLAGDILGGATFAARLFAALASAGLFSSGDAVGENLGQGGQDLTGTNQWQYT